MIPEIGHFALIVAAAIALVLGILPIAGAARSVPGWIAVARLRALEGGARDEVEPTKVDRLTLTGETTRPAV